MKKLIDVVKIKERKDGSADLTIDYTLEFADIVKAYYGKKKLTKKMLQKFVLNALKEKLK